MLKSPCLHAFIFFQPAGTYIRTYELKQPLQTLCLHSSLQKPELVCVYELSFCKPEISEKFQAESCCFHL